jgi:nucleotide-binding universal stress UspA family protein
MKTILVPTDFSKAATNAAEYAANLATHIKAKIILLNVYHLPLLAGDTTGHITDPDKLEHESEACLKAEAKRLMDLTGVVAKYRVKQGSVVDTILEEEKNASLIVMGIKEAGKLSETFIGSMATDAIHRSHKPVLVVPENAKFKALSKIAYACDYNENTDLNALNALKEIAKNFGSIVCVLNIKHKEDLPGVPAESYNFYKKIESKLANVKHIHSFKGADVLSDGINEYVDTNSIDMLTVIPHQMNLIDRTLHKSASTKMAHRATVPVLALPENYASVPGYIL